MNAIGRALEQTREFDMDGGQGCDCIYQLWRVVGVF